MVDDDARPERDKNDGTDQKHQKKEKREVEGPFAVWDRSTLVKGRAALPPPVTSPAGPPADANGSAPAASRPAPPDEKKEKNEKNKKNEKDEKDDEKNERVRQSVLPRPRFAPDAEEPPGVVLEKAGKQGPSSHTGKSAKARRKAVTERRDSPEADRREPEGQPAAPESTVTLWGGMESGKSTLLAALSRAVQDPVYGKWNIWPEDHVSRKFLSDLGRILYRERRFPPATLTEQRPIRFTLAGDLAGTRFSRAGRRWWKRGRPAEPEPVEFKVTVRDMPGEAFDPYSHTGSQYEARLIKDLAASRAMVYVVDPVREWRVNSDDGAADTDARQNADFFTDVLAGVLTETNIRGDRQGNLLPHRIAVCLAKFDDDRVFRFACEQGNVRLNPRTGQPEVMDAKRLFDGLCETFPHGSLREIQQQIESFFAPERVGYFVCSAVGFWVDPERGFDFENPSLVNQVEDTVRFVAAPRPINVLEPFLFLRGFGPMQS
ncbi:hypothetical protein [Streptomyces thermoalcalitolerans]|uniref:ATP-binding protein n=1 Tax=Streptomyces thermoalcalitolerans TaxID=65605 RepID=A0ABP4A1F1_9ACTN